MADLVSGKLKEEKDAHSSLTGAFKWPCASTRNLLYRYARKHVRQCSIWVPAGTFGSKQAQTEPWP